MILNGYNTSAQLVIVMHSDLMLSWELATTTLASVIVCLTYKASTVTCVSVTIGTLLLSLDVSIVTVMSAEVETPNVVRSVLDDVCSVFRL